MTLNTDHYSASKIVTWVSAIVIPLAACFAWVADRAMTMDERLVSNSAQIQHLSDNQAKLIAITDRLSMESVAGKTLLKSVKEGQDLLIGDLHDVVKELHDVGNRR